MCERTIDRKIDLLNRRRNAYEQEVDFWTPSDTEEAMVVYDFEDFLQTAINYWNLLCRYRDQLSEHCRKCNYDHSQHFQDIQKAMEVYARFAGDLESVVSKFEHEFSTIEHAKEYRETQREAQIMSLTFPDLCETQTPIADWGE